MNRVAKQRVGTTKVLTDPVPQFVSLVKAGANMTPFTSIKAEDDPAMTVIAKDVRVRKRSAAEGLTEPHPLLEQPEPATKDDGQTDETKPEEAVEAAPAPSLKAEGYDVKTITFKGEAFTEEAVKSWLDKGGYVDFDLIAIDGGFSVTAKEQAELEDTREVQVAEGITAVVGKIKTADPEEIADATNPEDTSAVVVDAAPAAAPTTKSEEPAADGEVAKKSLGTVCSLTEVVRQLSWIAYDEEWEAEYRGEDASAAVAEIKQLSASALTLLAKFAGEEAAKLISQKSEEAAAKAAAKAEAEKATKSEETAPAAAPVVDTADIVAKAVAAALAPLAQAMTDISKTVKEQGEALTQSQKEFTERVAALETVEQTRKSADPEGKPASSLKEEDGKTPARKSDSQVVRDLSLRSGLGLSIKSASI